MNDENLVDLPASQLRGAVAKVLEDTSPSAHEADLITDVILNLRDAGHLSESTSDSITSLIYQRHMHSGHTGEFRVTRPIQDLKLELDGLPQGSLPLEQIDPVAVPARVVEIVAGIAVPDPRADATVDGGTDPAPEPGCR